MTKCIVRLKANGHFAHNNQFFLSPLIFATPNHHPFLNSFSRRTVAVLSAVPHTLPPTQMSYTGNTQAIISMQTCSGCNTIELLSFFKKKNFFSSYPHSMYPCLTIGYLLEFYCPYTDNTNSKRESFYL